MRFPLAAAAGLFVVFGAFAQPVVVGRIPPEFGGTFPGAGPHTFVDLAHPANRDGNLTTASMVWSSFVPSPASCTAAFKIKILRRDTGLFFVVAERGPFAAQAGFATVTLSPPIPVLAGDLLAVVQLQDTTLCGSVGAAVGGPHDLIMRYFSDFSTGSFANNGFFSFGTALMANATSDSEAVAEMLPVVGSAAGIGTFFRTDLQLLNPINQTIKGKLVFHPATGVASPGDPSIDYNYSALTSTSIPDIVAFMGQSGLGSLDVVPSSGPPPRIVARIYSDNGTAGTAGFTMDSFAPDQALRRNVTYLMPVAADLTAFRMNVGIRTLEDGVTIAINHGATSVIKTYAANHFEQGTLAAFLGEQPAVNSLYRITIQSGSAFIYTTTTDNRTNDTTVRFLSVGQ